MTAVTLGNSSTVRAGDPILIIGNNEGYVFSAIEGVVSDVRVISDTPGTRPSIDIETTTDSGGGSSGSPVWNAQSELGVGGGDCKGVLYDPGHDNGGFLTRAVF